MSDKTLTVLVYSDDANTRDQVRLSLGRRPAADLPPVEYVECATQWAVLERLGAGDVDLAILDGEAAPAGGLGVCRTIREEIFTAPPILVLLGRPQDAWLASWARADAVVMHPLDPVTTAAQAATLLRGQAAPSGSTAVAPHA
jgi:DNA-binding response OmpR family regulator